MSLNKELKEFYTKVGFGESIGKRALTVPVYTGCLLVPLPNIEMRHKYLKYHDLHHLITNFILSSPLAGRYIWHSRRGV